MAVVGRKGIGIPTLILHETENHTVTVELKNGNTYQGFLAETEDNWNMLITNVELTRRDGRQSKLHTAYIRGDQVCFIALPPMLQNAPMFKRVLDFRNGKPPPKGDGLSCKKERLAEKRVTDLTRFTKAGEYGTRAVSKIVCMNCRKTGHYARECPVCLHCGKNGHLKKDCPLLQRF